MAKRRPIRTRRRRPGGRRDVRDYETMIEELATLPLNHEVNEQEGDFALLDQIVMACRAWVEEASMLREIERSKRRRRVIVY